MDGVSYLAESDVGSLHSFVRHWDGLVADTRHYGLPVHLWVHGQHVPIHLLCCMRWASRVICTRPAVLVVGEPD